ncbi:PREDICTED: uncharacterized protein LOC107080780 isoform X2 [Cyprinodon variegatus]|uniref:uncharacterized protein LOC107080780 isoform X2 n=1 Tax=Cyprinodon variegatus TaxID=28743 RepID=UPI000742BA39|nr:PREDICTED: uncharacterized protein LOC107080780 isoform X2 [Cyprinodon variegatus]
MSNTPGLQLLKPETKNLAKPCTRVLDEFPDPIYEDPDSLLNSIPDVSQSESIPKPVPVPRRRYRQNLQLYDSKNTTKANYVSKTTPGKNNNMTNTTATTWTTNIPNIPNTNFTNYSTDRTLETNTIGRTRTDLDSDSDSDSIYSLHLSEPLRKNTTYATTVTLTQNIKTPTLTSVGTVNSTYNDHRTNQTNTVYPSHKTAYTGLCATIQSRNDSEVYMIPRPVRQPQQIPPGANGIDTSTNGSLQYYDVRTDNKGVKKPPPPPPHPSLKPTPLYYGRENSTLQTRDNTNRAPPLHQHQKYHSGSMVDLRYLESRDAPPSLNPEEEPFMSSRMFKYNYMGPQNTDYLPNYDFVDTLASTGPYDADNQSTYDNLYQYSPEDIPELLFWLNKVSRQPDNLTQFGLSEEEEIRSFTQQANRVRKARRLYQLLMIKREKSMINTLKKFQAICEKLDKVFKKTVNREMVLKLVNDYKEDVVDLERCLNFILFVMKELQRHNIGKLKKVGANPDALRMVDLSMAVFSNNMYRSRQMSPTSPGGMSSGSLLKNFAYEFDHYFTEKNGQKLKKSNKSKFSARVCMLVEHLQEELNYLTHMWEALT